MSSIDYYLVRDKTESLTEEFNQLVSVIDKIQGLKIKIGNKIGFKTQDENATFTITYEKFPFKATLRLKKIANDPLSNKYNFPSILPVLTCEKIDNVTVNSLKAVIQRLGYRIFNTSLNCYLPQDINLSDVISIFDQKILDILNTKGFKPIFYLNDIKVMYAQSKKDYSIHLVNSYLLDFFLKFGTEEETPEFSYEVAPNLPLFVPLFDAGLIPYNFYQYYRKPTKIINYSFFDIENVKRKIFFKPYIYELNSKNQAFYTIASEGSSLIVCDKIRKGETLDDAIKRLLKEELKIADDYIGARVVRDIEFDRDKKRELTPRLLVFVYVDKIKNRDFIKERSQRTWTS